MRRTHTRRAWRLPRSGRAKPHHAARLTVTPMRHVLVMGGCSQGVAQCIRGELRIMARDEVADDGTRRGRGGETVLRPTSPAARLWRNRTFNIFWFGQTLSGLGDAVAMIAMPLLVLQVTGSVAQMGLVTGTFAVMQLVTGPFAGIVVDRLDRRRVMIACDLGRLCVYALIPAGWLLAGPQIWLIYATTALGAALDNVFSVGATTAIARLVDKEQLTEANGRLQIANGLTFVAGPLLAGVIIALFTPPAAIGVDAVSFLVSAVTLMCIRLRPLPLAGPAIGGERASHLGDLLAGIRFLVHQPLLRTVTLMNGIAGMVLLGSMDLFIYRLKHDLHQSAGTLGVVFGVASAGIIVAGVFTPRLRRRFGFGVCWIGGLGGAGLGLMAFAWTASIPLLMLILVLFLFMNTVTYVTNRSLRQEITPDHLLGRVTAASWTLSGITTPVGAAISTALAAEFGAPAVLVGMGVITALLAAVAVGTPVNHRRPERLYAPDRAEPRGAVP
jgi:MFS family permease